jgi:hypothetical protein
MIARASMGIAEFGEWLAEKWRNRLVESGGDYGCVARQMRKQGIPLDVAMAVLLGRAADR